MIRRPPRSTPLYSSAASDVYKRQEAHDVDRGVLGGQPPDELLPLGVGLSGQRRDRDRIPPVGGGRALLRQVRLRAVVGIDVPGQGVGTGTIAAGGEQPSGNEQDLSLIHISEPT